MTGSIPFLKPPSTSLLKDPYDVKVTVSNEADIGLVGVPWDWSTAGRPGARYAPANIRSQLYSLRPHAPGLYTGELRVRDLGDIDVVPGNYDETGRRVTVVAKHVYGTLRFTLFIGGDHSITRWTVEPLADTGVGLLVLDAHYDMRSVREGVTSGSWLYEVKARWRENVDTVIIGVADFLNPSYLESRARELGVRVVAAREVHRKGIEAALEAIDKLAEAGARAYYVSVDMDHLAEAYAHGVNSPSPLGLEPWQTIAILQEAFRKLRPVAADITEVVPAYDVGGATARLAAHIALYMLIEAGRR